MKTTWVRFLSPPKFSSYEQEQKARLLHYMLVAVFVGGLVTGISNYVNGWIIETYILSLLTLVVWWVFILIIGASTAARRGSSASRFTLSSACCCIMVLVYMTPHYSPFPYSSFARRFCLARADFLQQRYFPSWRYSQFIGYKSMACSSPPIGQVSYERFLFPSFSRPWLW